MTTPRPIKLAAADFLASITLFIKSFMSPCRIEIEWRLPATAVNALSKGELRGALCSVFSLRGETLRGGQAWFSVFRPSLYSISSIAWW